jgi:hypothetical protein
MENPGGYRHPGDSALKFFLVITGAGCARFRSGDCIRLRARACPRSPPQSRLRDSPCRADQDCTEEDWTDTVCIQSLSFKGPNPTVPIHPPAFIRQHCRQHVIPSR